MKLILKNDKTLEIIKTRTILGVFLLNIYTGMAIVCCDKSTPTDDGDNGNGQTTMSPPEYLSDLTTRLTLNQNVNLYLLGWFVIFDLEDDPHQVGFISRDGREKPAFAVWKSL